MASSGKITAHNLHLLEDDADDTPGDGAVPVMPDDDLNLRTATAGSPSSVDSRQMDESPVDDRASPANLSEEAKYQEELKERVKKSFADLGIEPEGVLLRDSLEETPRDSIEIKEDLPYEDAPQGEYDARRKKENPNDNDNEDEIDSNGVISDDDNGHNGHQDNEGQPQGGEAPLDQEEEDRDENFLADSLEADATHHQEQPSHKTPSENSPLHPEESDGKGNDDLPPEVDAQNGSNEEDEEENDFVRDSLETDRAESELHNLNDSNPISLGDDTVQDQFDGDASDSFPTPINQGTCITKDGSPAEEEEQFTHLSKPLQLEDGDDDESADPVHAGEDTDNSHGEDENFQDDVNTENNVAPSEQEYKNTNERTLSGNDINDDDIEFDNLHGNNRTQNVAEPQIDDLDATPLESGYDEEGHNHPLTEGSVPPSRDQFRDSYPDDNVQRVDEKPISSGSRHSDSREHSPSPQSAMLSSTNNNAKGPHGRPPSGGSVHSARSYLNRQSPAHRTNSGNQTPVRSRDNSRERGITSGVRQTPNDGARQTPSDRSLQTPPDRSRPGPTNRVSSGTSKPRSATRNGSLKSRSGSGGPRDQASRSPDSREGQRDRRGSNDIHIPRYSRKGMDNSDADKVSLREDLRNTENRDQGVRRDSGKAERASSGSGTSRNVGPVNQPNRAPFTVKPPPGPAKQNSTSPKDSQDSGLPAGIAVGLPGGRPGSTGKKPSPRDFMTPGQRHEIEENKQFWSDMHQAGVFNPSVNVSSKPRSDQVQKLKTGEKVRVEYISDDSGDEDLHFVDEKGSPIDQLGRPLFAPKTPETPDLRIMYRIKPSPPRQKSTKKPSSGRQQTRDLSAADSSRYGSGYSTRNASGKRSGREHSRIPVKQLVDRQISPIEDEISPVGTQQEGVLESTIPLAPQKEQSPRERPVKSACFQTGIDDLPPLENVEQSDFKSPVQEASIQTTERETAIQTSEEHITGNNDNSLPYQSPIQSPRNTREGGPFGQVRVAPYQQQGPGFQPPSPGYNPQGQMPFPAGAYTQQIPGNYQGNPQAHWQPVMGQPGYPNQGQQFAAPLQPQFVNPMMSPGMNQQIPPQMQNYPSPQYNPHMQDPMQQGPFQQPMPQQTHPGMPYPYQQESQGHLESPGRPFPRHEMEQPYSNDREISEQQERKPSNGPRRQQPKPRQNFIDLNKTSAKLRRDPPNKKYTETLQQKKGFKSPMNPRKPLPQISRENSLDDGQPSSTGWTPHGSATSRSNDQWAQAVLREQQMIMFARGMSDPNIYPQGQGPPPPPMRNGSVPGNYAGGTAYPGAYHTPDANFNQVNGQPYSWSADRANAYARMNAMQNANQGPVGGPFSMDPRGSFEMNQTSPRQRMAYTHPMPSRTSPFQVLPDIQSSGRRSGEDKELRTSDPDGYLMKLQKQKQGPQYKPYTLKDFQNLKKDFKLGGLGPDKETMGVRNEKVARQREYARQVMEQNKKMIRTNPHAGEKTPGKDSPQSEASKRELMLAYADSIPLPRIRDNKSPTDESPRDTRSVALEYAKKIPKPRIPTPPEVLHDRLYGSGANSRTSGAGSRNSGAGSRSSSVKEETHATHEENTALEMARLQELTERHKQEKDELDRLRKGGLT